ncbi:hypothetical protein WN943_010308 [Citrus x changshan-huyou]
MAAPMALLLPLFCAATLLLPCTTAAAAPLLALSLTPTVEHTWLLLCPCSRLASPLAPPRGWSLACPQPHATGGQPTDASIAQLLLTTHKRLNLTTHSHKRLK